MFISAKAEIRALTILEIRICVYIFMNEANGNV